MKKYLILGIGIFILAFTALSFAGNFLQWKDSTQVSAEITSSAEQWVRRGENSVNVEIRYPVGGETMNGTVNLTASTMEQTADNGKIDVLYMNNKPERVIPVAVLDKKKKAVPVMAGIGILVTLVGAFRAFKSPGPRTSAP
jgi:hypothetical protein